jgi:hypothetical protein
LNTLATRLKKMRHLSRIVGVPIGTNLLGLLEIFAFIGVSSILNYIPRVAGIVLLPAGFFGIVGLDLWWRIGQPERSVWVRLFSLFTGGCFAFLPMWLIFLGGLVAGLVALLVK